MQSGVLQVDERVESLVLELNEFPGVTVFSSCGGHQVPIRVSQCPRDQFEVNFNIYPLHGGWRSLELITSVVCGPRESHLDSVVDRWWWLGMF
jgi:hypothetical protein